MSQETMTVDEVKAAAKRPVWAKTRGRGVRRAPGEMNKTELAYSQYLDGQKTLGNVVEWWFEGITFKLARDCRYTPDFIVLLSSGLIEAHEVKGHWEDDAKVKIRVAASMFPFRFVAVKKLAKKDGGGWREDEF